MSGVAGRSGRKKFVPTPDHRDLVTLLATRGIPQEYIRRLIRNPQTGRPVSIKTLERAFATEIKTAKVEFACQIARFVMDSILGRRSVNAKPIKDERLRATLAIFVARTRLGWTLPNRHHRVRSPIDTQESLARLDAKIARSRQVLRQTRLMDRPSSVFGRRSVNTTLPASISRRRPRSAAVWSRRHGSSAIARTNYRRASTAPCRAGTPTKPPSSAISASARPGGYGTR